MPPLLVEIGLGSMLRLARRATGLPLQARRLELARAHREGDVALLQPFFGGVVTCNAPIDTLVLDASVLDLPFITRDESVLEALAPRLAALTRMRGDGPGVVQEVSAVLNRSWTGQPMSVRQVARAGDELAVAPASAARARHQLSARARRYAAGGRAQDAGEYGAEGQPDRILVGFSRAQLVLPLVSNLGANNAHAVA